MSQIALHIREKCKKTPSHIAPFIHTYDKENKKFSYGLLGYGTDINAKLQNYLHHIPQDESGYKDFVAGMRQSEETLKKQFQPVI